MGKKYPYIVSDQEKKITHKVSLKILSTSSTEKNRKRSYYINVGLVELLHFFTSVSRKKCKKTLKLAFFSHQTHITTYARRQAVEMWRCAKLSTNTKTQNFLTITRLLKMATKFMPIFATKKGEKSDLSFFSGLFISICSKSILAGQEFCSVLKISFEIF